VPAPNHLIRAVTELGNKSGQAFLITENPVIGTELYVVYVRDFKLPPKYSPDIATFGFRVPTQFPNACPEDSFFLIPCDVSLSLPNPERGSTDINRARKTEKVTSGTELGDGAVLLFSWHLWDRVPWDRSKHQLIDHYEHCLRRFDQPEHG
jgi:hypothetical protein